MLSLEQAGQLLADAASSDGVARLVHALGITGPPRELDSETKRALGVPAIVSNAVIVRGPGALRALSVDLSESASIRESLTALAHALSASAPQLLWLVVAVDKSREHVALAAWTGDRTQPRTIALVCRVAAVVECDAETVCALAAAIGSVDVLVHARWTEILGRDALTRRFYRSLETVVESLAGSIAGAAEYEDARELAILNVSRLLFLSFLETQGWLDGDHGFLSNGFAECMGTAGEYHRRVLAPLFFGTLNTRVSARQPRARAFGRIPFLNGGLFSRTALERRVGRVWFTDEALGLVFGDLLCRHRFTPREENGEWSEAAIDPEMLGKSFESLMASRDRKSSGAFYTPQPLVEQITRKALTCALIGPDASEDALSPGACNAMDDRARAALLAGISGLRALDPACGSGAFLVTVLAKLVTLSRALGDVRDVGEITRCILTRSIFGVDINATAVWLCQLRLWLAMVIEQRALDPCAVSPLPNLDRQIRVGDALAGRGGKFGLTAVTDSGRYIQELRRRYSRVHGRRKATLARMLDREERARAVAIIEHELTELTGERRERIIASRSHDLFGQRSPADAASRLALRTIRHRLREMRARKIALQSGAALPFSFATHFADVAARGGFDLVIGNPPWVRLHRVSPRTRTLLKRDFYVYRNSSWSAGAASSGAGVGFASQVDLAALFVERAIDLVRSGGTSALLLPAKLWRSLAGGGVRQLITERCHLVRLEDMSADASWFDAAVYPSLCVARRCGMNTPSADARTTVSVRRGSDWVSWRSHSSAIAFDPSPGAPWLVAPRDVRRAFDLMRRSGVPLASSEFGRPRLGVKSGCNEAFIVEVLAHERDVVRIRSGPEEGTIEGEVLRPSARGEQISAWRFDATGEHIVWTHSSDDKPLERLPPLTKKWLERFRSRLEARADARACAKWWTLFRTEAARSDSDRVVWADIARSPRATVLFRGDPTVPLNSCYVAPCAHPDDALALAAILNSELAAAWLNLLAEPARGGYHRYLGWTMGLFPLPVDWDNARLVLAPVGRAALGNPASAPSHLLETVLGAYGLRHRDVAPLLAWSG